MQRVALGRALVPVAIITCVGFLAACSTAVESEEAAAQQGQRVLGSAQPGDIEYRPVTDDMLSSPAAGDWLMYRRTYDSWGYSPLDQINAANVGSLVPVWLFSTGVISGHQAPPQVNDGVMFVTTPESQVLALTMRLEIRASASCGIGVHSAVIKSLVVTALIATAS